MPKPTFNPLSGKFDLISTAADFATEFSEFPVDINRQGIIDRNETTISFNGTNTFTITDTGSGWSYYRAGLKYTITGNKTVVIPGTPIADGNWYIYIDSTDGSLTASQTVWTLTDTKVPISSIVFHNSMTPKYWLADERHSAVIDSFMQYYLHHVDGARSISTPTLTGYTVNTDTNVAKTFAISAGTLVDQDYIHNLPLLTDPDGTATDYVVWYRTAADTWAWKASNMPFAYNIGNTNDWIQYDNAGTMTDLTGGSGSNARFVNSYLLMTNKEGAARFIIIPGRSVYTSADAAKSESIGTFTWEGFSVAESVICYQLTWSTITSTSQGKCRLISTPTFVNISTVTNVSSGAGTDHNTLSNLQGGQIGEYYHLTSADSTEAIAFLDGGTSTHTAVDSAVTASHARSHSITSTSDHTSTATSGQMLKADANGLPVNATNTDAQVSATVTASHAAATVTDSATIDFTLTGQDVTASVKSASITEAMQVLADNTTQNVSTSKHGYIPKLPNDATKFLDGTGTWVVTPTAVSIQIDQSGGTSDTYGVLAGLVNSSNKVFTVSLSKYVTGSLSVYLNGQLQTQGTGEDWTETTPASGTFTFVTAPITGDLITVKYQYTSGATGNADTLDGQHGAYYLDHTNLTNKGANTHAQIDANIAIPKYLPFGIFTELPPYTAASNPFFAGIDRTYTFKSWSQTFMVDSTNSGNTVSNYWTIGVYTYPAYVTIKVFTTASPLATANVFMTNTFTAFTTPSVTTSDISIIYYCSKTGTPGKLYMTGPLLEI